jgi:hypothetical protein
MIRTLLLALPLLLIGCKSTSPAPAAQQSGRFGPPAFSANSPLGSFHPTTGTLGRPVDMGMTRQSPSAFPSSWKSYSPTGR